MNTRPSIGTRPAAQRSRVTNGKALFADGGDNRTAWARRFRDVQSIHEADLGGLAALSGAEASLIRRAAVLTIELERIEARFSKDDDPSPDALDLYQRMTNTLRRLLETLGIQRRPRDVAIDLRAYLASAARDGAASANANPEPPEAA
jgi:hypothetical protein